MTTRYVLFAAAAAVAMFAMQSSAQALTITECSAKYKDAKAAGTLNGATWNDFRKSQCDLAPRKRTASVAGSDVTVVAANAVFPTAVDSKYSSEKPGRARRKTWPRSIQGQQGDQCQWRAEMAAKGRRLLQPMRQEAQRRGVVSSWRGAIATKQSSSCFWIVRPEVAGPMTSSAKAGTAIQTRRSPPLTH